LRTPNIDKELMSELESRYSRKVTPEELLGYIYAVLNSPKYRAKYAEHLKMDFPRIPFPQDTKTFDQVSEIGKRLIELHLERATFVCHTRFDVADSNFVKFVRYKEKNVYINETQFFEEIPEDLWAFQICGVQVLHKWLKGRKGRALKPSEVEHFIRIVEIVRTTIQLMRQVDSVISI
jgi:predicted helicase